MFHFSFFIFRFAFHFSFQFSTFNFQLSTFNFIDPLARPFYAGRARKSMLILFQNLLITKSKFRQRLSFIIIH